MPRGLDWEDATTVDRLTVAYLNKLYLEGFQASRGDRLTAALLHFQPKFGKTWSGESSPHMAGVEGVSQTYPRQEPLGLSPDGLGSYGSATTTDGKTQDGAVRPRVRLQLCKAIGAHQTSSLQSCSTHLKGSPGHGPLLMSPEERPHRSKTGEFDNSVSLDSPWLIPWVHTLFEYLKQNHPSSQLWDFDYNQLSTEFKKAATALGLELTPYQARHSGPSIDRARNYRSQLEVQKRGQWKSQSSVQRYEKSARLAATAESLSQALQSHCRLCEENLGAIMLGYQTGPVFAKST